MDAAGIVPNATLHHFVHPQVRQELGLARGGFTADARHLGCMHAMLCPALQLSLVVCKGWARCLIS